MVKQNENKDEVSKLLARAKVKTGAKFVQKKPGRPATGPQPVPELDPHVQMSYETGETLELMVPEDAAPEVQRRIRKSARYLSAQLDEAVRVKIQAIPRANGKVAIRFRAHAPAATGAAVHKKGPNAARWGRA